MDVWRRSAAGLCLVGSDGVIRRVNDAFAAALGFEADELEGLPIARLHPPDMALAMRAMHDAVVADDNETEWTGREMKFVHRRGRPVVAFSRNARVQGSDGEVLRLITFVDMSKMARGDRQLQLLHRMENFDALASAIANDFNNLLAIILGYSALLQEGTADSRRLRVVAEGVEGAVERASTLVRQSLYLVRRPDAVLRGANLAEMVEARVQQLRMAHGDRPIDLSVSMSSELRAVPIDVDQLGDAIDNLFGRLHQLDPKGQRALRIRTLRATGAELRSRYAQADDGAYAVIEISHPGLPRSRSRPPIPLHEQTQTAPSHDLGFTMVERIVESHSGFLGQQEQANGGLLFAIHLPLAATEHLTKAETSQSKPPMRPAKQAGQRSILVVDDEQGLLDAISETLQRAGFEVFAAKDGTAALDLFTQHRAQIDLVICDLVLPGMNGWEVFTSMRELQADVTVLIMSGHLEPKLQSAVSRSGAAGFLQKPFSMTAFMRVVRTLV
ncbi:response regulator [Synoicihabitans lomoniglobus]|uniref:histidine kinase n=1 Tax=Synoicihabitans lomoniglobus TaxID=2909285 RepID=A0AAE9ZRV0_9BACT|nr:response regulator [Opitutaceae bacterium LMO-M01]WED63042.1 response regulator [Opitutaceae bacterium LMO-M01]